LKFPRFSNILGDINEVSDRLKLIRKSLKLAISEFTKELYYSHSVFGHVEGLSNGTVKNIQRKKPRCIALSDDVPVREYILFGFFVKYTGDFWRADFPPKADCRPTLPAASIG
jgi:hypothetical protein